MTLHFWSSFLYFLSAGLLVWKPDLGYAVWESSLELFTWYTSVQPVELQAPAIKYTPSEGSDHCKAIQQNGETVSKWNTKISESGQ